jgi:hypothetical protein
MTRVAIFSAAGIAVLTLAAMNEAGAAGRLPAGVPAAAQLLLRYDANNDGVITREEMDAGLKTDFTAADGNGDGCLNPAEVSAENARRLARDGSEASPLRDWNLDGCVDIREFSNTAHSYFDLADRSKDSRVTVLELRGPSMPIAPPTSTKPRATQASQASQNSLGAPQYQTGQSGNGGGPYMGR